MRRSTPADMRASLQSGLNQEHLSVFDDELGAWFPAMKWLIKEFRLHIGYETPDEEAGIRFWIDRFERARGPEARGRTAAEADAEDWEWPTADEPALPATPQEVQQARRWPRDLVEKYVDKLFELRRRLCPSTPILVPLQQLKHYEAPRGFTPGHRRAALHQHAEPSRVRTLLLPPGTEERSPPSPATGSRTLPRKVLSRETQDRLFPTSMAGAGRLPLSDEQFASRVVDLAIEFDGDSQRATQYAHKLLAQGSLGEGAGGTAPPRRWHEGRSALQDLRLTAFWRRLGGKGTLGLQLPPAKADRLLEERARGDLFAEAVMRTFCARFGYESLDAGALYRFWLSMPTAVRSAQHVRGPPNTQAYELLREGVRRRADKKAAAQAAGVEVPSPAPSPASGAARPAWKPGGEHLQLTTPPLNPVMVGAATAIALPAGTPRATSLDVLARPKVRSETLVLLASVARRFKEDPVVQRMVRQCLDGSAVWRGLKASSELEAYDFLHEVDMVKRVVSAIQPKPVPALVDVQTPVKLQAWLAGDAERASKLLEHLGKAQETTKRINNFIKAQAKQYLSEGYRIGLFGLYFPAKAGEAGHKAWADDEEPRDARRVHGLMLVEDVFAKLCRKEGASEVLARFNQQGRTYLPAHDRAAPGGLLAPGLAVAPGTGGPTLDCAARRACCLASSSAAGCDPDQAVDGDPATGWRPEPLRPDPAEPTWWMADLGGFHSCTGVFLDWSLPRRRTVSYESRFQLRADLALEGGRGSPIVATYVRSGGVASRAGVVRGDVLQLDAGGDGDQEFADMAPLDALAALQAPEVVQQPLRLVFEGRDIFGTFKASGLGRPQPLTVQVKLLAGKAADKPPPPRDFENIAEAQLEVVPGRPCPLPGVFVGRWVRLEFTSPWPEVEGRALLLTVRVVKVWRLAPPAFRQRFTEEAIRQQSKRSLGVQGVDPHGKGGGLPKGLRGFWVPGERAKSFNAKVVDDIRQLQLREHDYEGEEEELLKKACKRDNKEFNVLRSSELLALRKLIFAREEDVRECTFHPRTAGNVAAHVLDQREKVSDRLFKQTSLEDFVKELGENYNSSQYPNYQIVHRRMELSRVKKDFSHGNIIAALDRLQSKFGVEQILERFRCFHKGCGQLIDQKTEMCSCSGFYCPSHKDKAVHNCVAKKKELQEKAKRQKARDAEMRQEGQEPPPEEKFDNKVELGLILEVCDLAERILAAKRSKEEKRHSLERLSQSLAHFGAIGLLDRPFRAQMCPTALVGKRSWTQEGGKRVPLYGSDVGSRTQCGCDKAHRPIELRFEAGESVKRRAEWMMEAIEEFKYTADVVPGSEAERSKLRKEGRAKTQPRRRSTSALATALRRARSEPRRLGGLRQGLDDRERDVSRSLELLGRAREQLDEGRVEAARVSLEEARRLAAAAAFVPGLSEGLMGGPSAALAASPAPASPRLEGLRAQIRALAGVEGGGFFMPPASTTGLSGGRPLRDCERGQLLRRSEELDRDARETLSRCSGVADEVARAEQSRYQQASAGLPGPSAAFFPSPVAPLAPPPPPAPAAEGASAKAVPLLPFTRRASEGGRPAGSAASTWQLSADAGEGIAPPAAAASPAVPPLPLPPTASLPPLPPPSSEGLPLDRDRGKATMCAEFLDSGHCARGTDCPNAHHPAELAPRGWVAQQRLY